MKKIKFNKVGKNDCDSFPLGNGDIGINVWVEENNRISMYISKTDSFSSSMELLKIGKVNIELINAYRFKFISYQLNVDNGVCSITYDKAKIKIFVDAFNPCIRINIESKESVMLKVSNEIWREEDKQLEGDVNNRTLEFNRTVGQDNLKEKVITYKDVQVTKYDGCTMWYHQNMASHYENNLEHQGILHLKHLYDDPLLYRTFGACIQYDYKEIERKSHDISITVLTQIIKDVNVFTKNLYNLSIKNHKMNYKKCLIKHKKQWKKINEKSYIKISGDKKAKLVDSGYKLQRYMNICAGRGEFPIKFNGSIFTFQIENKGQIFDPDYRMWGGCYWFQNTRLIYWSMLNAGDFDLLKPFFELYEKSYEIVKAKTNEYYGFEGLLYPETMTLWGTHRNVDYGFNREDIKKGDIKNKYLKHYHSGMLELITIMIEYYKYTNDEQFKNNLLLKHAKGVLDFFFNSYKQKDDNGKIVIYPSQALENWQDAKNPTDVVAGLKHVLSELNKLKISNKQLKNIFIEYEKLVPDIAMFKGGGNKEVVEFAMIKPAKEYDELGNLENPELYAIFPYRIFSFEKENVKIGRETFKRRNIRNNFGWSQDGIQAATLAMPEASKQFVEEKFSTWNKDAKFQAFWGPNFDWVPDQDHGTSASIALQKMLIQCEGEKIYLFPAWPKQWDVKFKVHVYKKTIVEGQLIDGKVTSLSTIPSNRINDIEICFDKQINKW